jgi:hypothetical protein
MSPQPHEGPAEDGLSRSILPVVHHQERIDSLRRVLSGFSHRCRNSLNGIKMSLYLVRRAMDGPTPPCWKELERTYREIERLFDHLQTIYRPMTVTIVRARLGQLVADHAPNWRSWFESGRRALRIEAPSPDPSGDFDPMHLGMGLDALVAWRAEARDASRQPRLTWRIQQGSFVVCWDEAPSPSPELLADVRARESRGTEPSRGVNSLALPLLARIVAEHGGSLESSEPTEPNFSVRVRWPQYRS